MPRKYKNVYSFLSMFESWKTNICACRWQACCIGVWNDCGLQVQWTESVSVWEVAGLYYKQAYKGLASEGAVKVYVMNSLWYILFSLDKAQGLPTLAAISSPLLYLYQFWCYCNQYQPFSLTSITVKELGLRLKISKSCSLTCTTRQAKSYCMHKSYFVRTT